MIAFADEAKVEFNDIPFKGPAEEILNVRSGQIDFAAVPLTAAAGSGCLCRAFSPNSAIRRCPTCRPSRSRATTSRR